MLGEQSGTYPNKMRQAQGKSSICPVCRGQKVVEGRAGVKLTCHACRGTGVASGNYATK